MIGDDRVLRKKILVLTPRFPYPIIGGDRLRIYHICRALSQRYDLTLLSLCDTQDEMSFIPKDSVFSEIHKVYHPRRRSLRNTFAALFTKIPLQLAYYRSREFATRCAELTSSHDLVLAHLIRTGQYLENVGDSVPKILEMTDAVSLNYSRIKSLTDNRSFRRLVYSLEQGRLESYERQVVDRFERVWLVSDVDRRFLGLDRHSHVAVLPNGVDVNALNVRSRQKPGNVIVFIGNMVSTQNQDACFHFANEILPRLVARIDVRFRIVGNSPEGLVRKFRRISGVEATGRVVKVSDEMNDVFVGVCPVRAAAGMQNKILEYFALGIPCVTTQAGLEGISAVPGRDVLVYHSAEHAVELITNLYRDHQLQQRMAKNGRNLVEHCYSWERIDKKILASAGELLEE